MNQLSDIDGQDVAMHPDGFLVITKSPRYKCMKLPDYYKMAEIYFKGRREADKERLKKLQQQCRETGQPVPSQLPVRGLKRIPLEALPKWPEWAKKYEF
jgi:hypothetical protein